MLVLKKKIKIDKDVIEAPNLANRFDDEDLTTIGGAVWEGYMRDKLSRIRWEKRSEAAMDLAMQVQKDKNFPWPGASNVIFPLVTIAALQFSARSYSNIIQGTDVVRYRIMGSDTDGTLRARADRISKHMSWQVLEEDCSWEEQHDRLLINLAIVGTNFIKTYFSPSLRHNVSELVMASDLVMDYYAKSVNDAARKTQIIRMYRNEIYERVMNGTFTNVLNDEWFQTLPVQEPLNVSHDNRQGKTISASDEDTPFTILEQHRLLDLDGDGYSEPYIVYIEEASQKVLRIVARYEREEDVERNSDGKIIRIHPTEYFTKYSFIPSPDGGIYDVGFGQLLGPLNESVNSGINQLLDAGTMQNSNGGFLGRGAKIRGGVYTMAPWEWKRVDSTGDDLRKSMVPLPIREPSNVMFQLLGLLINYTDRVAGTVDSMVGENPGQNTPAETSRNTTEQGMQVYSMIFKRIWRSMKEEFNKLHKLNAVFMNQTMYYGAQKSIARQEDYKSDPNLVAPVADPNITSSGMRLMQAQLVRQAAHTVPGYNIELVEKKFLRAIKIEDIDEIYPGADKVPPLPNPKLQVEEMKLKAKEMQFKHEKEVLIINLMSQKGKNDAEIKKIHAEILQIINGVQDAKAELRLKTFETAVAGLQAHNEMLSQTIETLNNLGGNDEGGGVSNMAGRPGNTGVPGNSTPVAGGAQGAMGAG
jgi:chaperonin GroES